MQVLPREPLDARGRAWRIPPGGARRFVVTDIHGCHQTFLDFLDEAELRPADRLFVLGDMINRGPYSLAVLETLARLLVDGFSVYLLRGNHEEMFLGGKGRFGKGKRKSAIKRRNALHLLDDEGALRADVKMFLNELPYYFDTQDGYMVHAGFDTADDEPFERWKKMLTLRKFRYDAALLGDKPVFHGHVPTNRGKIRRAVERLGNDIPHGESRIVSLDNGCINVKKASQGSLACLELSSMKLDWYPNRDVVPD